MQTKIAFFTYLLIALLFTAPAVAVPIFREQDIQTLRGNSTRDRDFNPVESEEFKPVAFLLLLFALIAFLPDFEQKQSLQGMSSPKDDRRD